ncbi:MAG: AMP-binding protein [Planctomycetes bacterium]|nr:AMP-binding protein [Planctomycetota bacterium]MCL4729460.1 AMP-binding protein [Planctomycetota bacterium]
MSDRFDWQLYYPPGLRRQWQPPAKFLWQYLEENAARRPDRPAIYFEDVRVTWGELWQRVRVAAATLRTRGFARGKRGDRVLLLLPNCPEFVVQYYAALRADMIVVAQNPGLTHEELAPVLASVEPRAAFVAPEAALSFERARQAANVRDPKTFYVSPGQDFRTRPQDPDILPAILGDAPPVAARHAVDIAVLQFTSGTTGGLKAAMMSHRNLAANAEQNNRWFEWTPDDVILGALPLYHTWGMCCVMNAAVVAGAAVALLPQFNAVKCIELIRRHRVSVAYGSGTMFARLLESAGTQAAGAFSSLRYVKAGAMLIDHSLNQRWAAAVPNVPMVNGYGLTEASPELTNNPPQRVRTGTVGVPLPGTELRVCDPLRPERELEPGQEGEVQARGPQVMLGYWSEPEATRAAILPGGWLRTGDLGMFDAEGYLRIVDRLKDLIKFRGYSVAPSEVERVLATHPSVQESCVVGRPDPTEGEVPVAYVVLKPGAPLDVTELPGFVEPHLASFKRPRRYHIVHEIPRNHVGKPLRRVLRELPEPGTGLARS